MKLFNSCKKHTYCIKIIASITVVIHMYTTTFGAAFLPTSPQTKNNKLAMPSVLESMSDDIEAHLSPVIIQPEKQKESVWKTIDKVMSGKVNSFLTGISFGLTSSIILTLGLMFGLYSGTHSKTVVLGGILTIAIADSFSDAFAIHVSEESKNTHSPKEIWITTVSTFFTKLICALTFVIPVVFLQLSTAIVVALVWAFILLSVLSYYLAVRQKINPWKVILEHLIIASIVVLFGYFSGDLIRSLEGSDLELGVNKNALGFIGIVSQVNLIRTSN